MGRVSVFSRDYNRRMKKRKKIRVVLSTISLVFIGTVVLILASDIGDGKLLAESSNEEVSYEESGNNDDIEEVMESIDEPEVLEVKFDINGESIIFNCIDEGGIIKFNELKEDGTKIYYKLNNNKDMVVMIDNNQNMYIGNISGEISDITLKEYISTTGQKFNKDAILEMYKGYIWNSDAIFLDDERIAYISNIPYFGTDLSKYVAIINLKTNERTTMWQYKGKDVKFDSFDENGLKVIIDGNIKNIK